jgi:CubicO group peptidase (beta-lactamase class C family)
VIHVLLAHSLFIALPPSADEVDRTVRRALEQWKVPGLAIVLIQDDRVFLLRGYGLASIDAKAPVTPDTVFPLASCTKPFTSTLLAMLVDDGKLAWDDRVSKHLPYFKLKDPFANERVTLRDLLCHRTGLGPHTMLWYRSPLSVEERVRKLALLEPGAEFRTAFQYQTIAFDAAALAGELAAGRSWSDLMDQRLLKPLGMASSSPVQPKSGMAGPHKLGKDGVVEIMPRYDLTTADPAGSLHATARDLAPFLRLQLQGGRHAGQRLVSPARIHDLHQPNCIIPREGAGALLNPETVQISYGLGWIVQDYRGRKMILHGGAIDGFRAHLALVPEAKLGIGILSNLDSSLCNFALANSLTDLFLGAPPRAWNDELLKFEQFERVSEANRASQFRKNRPAGAKPPRPLADYPGDYTDEAYGTCQIAAAKGGLELKWGTLRCPLEHYVGDFFVANEPPFRDAPLEFVAGPGGTVIEIRFLERRFLRKS